MPDASWFQNNFLGGEISPDAQGNFDDPMYAKSMALCRNAYILPTGAHERRQGTRVLGGVRGNTPRGLYPISLANGRPVLCEYEQLQYIEPIDFGSNYFLGGLFLWAPPYVKSSEPNDLQYGVGAPFPTFTYGTVRAPYVPVFQQFVTVSSISSATPAVFTLSATVTWQTGDRVVFYVDDPNPATASVLRARTFIITMLTNQTFTIVPIIQWNSTVVGLDGSTIVNRTGYSAIYAGHCLRFVNPMVSYYASAYGFSTSGNVFRMFPDDVNNLRVIQTATNQAFFLFPRLPPWLLDFSNPLEPGFVDANSNWWDGPWCDPPVGASQTGNMGLAITANTGSTITLEYDGVHTIPEIVGVGQGIRLWTQPAAWSAAGGYAVGESVTYNGVFYTTSETITGVVPGNIDPATGIYPWSIDETLGTWSNGFLVSQTTTTMTFQIVSAQQVPSYSPSNIIETYQVGLYYFAWAGGLGGDGNEMNFAGRGPANGAWHEGRLLLIGAGEDLVTSYPAALGSPLQFANNRFDTSEALQSVTVGGSIPTLSTTVPVVTVPQWSPTDQNGNVLDSNGISYTINSNIGNSLQWAQPDAQGILLGTNTEEWLITASALNDPITPTSIQAHRQTTFGSEPIQPILTGLAVLFAQQNGLRVVEYVADVLSQRFTGQPLNERALHMTGWPSIQLVAGKTYWTRPGIKKMGYQPEPYPFIWLVLNDGTLACCTYRRLSRFGQEAPVLNAWHTHMIGDGARIVDAMGITAPVPAAIIPVCSETADAALLPTSSTVFFSTTLDNSYTRQLTVGSSYLEMLMPPYGPNGNLNHAWFLDSAYSGGIDGLGVVQDVTSGVTTTTIYGLADSAGATMSVYACGTYIGDYAVAADGSVTVAQGTMIDNLVDWNDNFTFDGDFWQLSSTQCVYSAGGSLTGAITYFPLVVGFKYTSTGQLLRPNSAQDAKTPTGPAIAKQRRFNMVGAHVQNAVEFNVAIGAEAYSQITYDSLGAKFIEGFVYPGGTFHPVPVVYPNGSAYSNNNDFPTGQLPGLGGGLVTMPSRPMAYNGILWAPVDDTYTFDGMIAWSVKDPYPCRVLSLGGFFQTQER